MSQLPSAAPLPDWLALIPLPFLVMSSDQTLRYASSQIQELFGDAHLEPGSPIDKLGLPRELEQLIAEHRELDCGVVRERIPMDTISGIGFIEAELKGGNAGDLVVILNDRRHAGAALRVDQLLQSLGHEIRTPLTSIRGFSDLLTRRTFKPEQAERYLQIIRSEALRLQCLVDNALDLQRMRDGRKALDFQWIELNGLLEELVNETSKDVPAAINLDQQVERAFVIADLRALKETLKELTENALRFGENSAVSLTLFQRGDEHVVRIANGGQEIPAEELPHIFTPFYRGLKWRGTHKIGGGLGLSRARELCRAHRGDLRLVSSGPGETVFELQLPAVNAPARSDQPTPMAVGHTRMALWKLPEELGLRVREELRGLDDAVESVHFDVEQLSESELREARCDALCMHSSSTNLSKVSESWEALHRDTQRPYPTLILGPSAMEEKGFAFKGARIVPRDSLQGHAYMTLRRMFPRTEELFVGVIDESAELRQAVARELGIHTRRLVTSGDPEACWQRIRQTPPDVLFLQLEQEGDAGYRLLHRLRKSALAFGTMVVALTDRPLTSREREFLEYPFVYTCPTSELDAAQLRGALDRLGLKSPLSLAG